MFTVIVLPAAREDIRTAATWYNQQQDGLGKRYTSQIRAKVAYIQKFPLTFTIRYDAVRAVVLDKFPYMIHFQADEKRNVVTIIAVFHTSRNPENWNDRLK